MDNIMNGGVDPEKYARDQKHPDRQHSTDLGKAATRIFMRAATARHKFEFPEASLSWDEPAYRFTALCNMFAKYLLNEDIDLKTGNNSAVITICNRSDGRLVVWANIFKDRLASEMYRICSHMAKDAKKAMRAQKKARRREK